MARKRRARLGAIASPAAAIILTIGGIGLDSPWRNSRSESLKIQGELTMCALLRVRQQDMDHLDPEERGVRVLVHSRRSSILASSSDGRDLG